MGKTIQVIAYLESLRYSNFPGGCLILAPSSVLQQWMYEFRKWAPSIRVYILHACGKHSSNYCWNFVLETIGNMY